MRVKGREPVCEKLPGPNTGSLQAPFGENLRTLNCRALLWGASPSSLLKADAAGLPLDMLNSKLAFVSVELEDRRLEGNAFTYSAAISACEKGQQLGENEAGTICLGSRLGFGVLWLALLYFSWHAHAHMAHAH